jgi:hypothetical protein
MTAGNGDKEFISEPITPVPDTFDAAAISRGEPGLPDGFSWRGRPHRIEQVIEVRKRHQPESSGELYLRRHEYRLRMEDGLIWEIYFLRHPPWNAARTAGQPRWFLKTIEEDPDR